MGAMLELNEPNALSRSQILRAIIFRHVDELFAGGQATFWTFVWRGPFDRYCTETIDGR